MNRPKCKCGNLAKKHRINSKGVQTYHTTCSSCQAKKYNQGVPGARGGSNRSAITRYTNQFKDDKCAECGFVAIDPCQLDIDHIDGNYLNNDPSNWVTLCANCHRLKTKRNKDTRPFKYQ